MENNNKPFKSTLPGFAPAGDLDGGTTPKSRPAHVSAEPARPSGEAAWTPSAEFTRAFEEPVRTPPSTPVREEPVYRNWEPERKREEPAPGARCPHCGQVQEAGAMFCGFCGSPMASKPVETPPPPPGGDRCPSCGEALEPGAMFCGFCGCSLAASRAATPPPMGSACPKCGAPLPEGARFCGECGQVLTGMVPVGGMPVKSLRPAGDRKKLLKWIPVAAAGLVVVVLLIVALATNFFGLRGPMNRILNAVDNTLKADTFAMDISFRDEWKNSSGRTYVDEVDGTVWVSVDMKARELMFYGEFEDSDGDRFSVGLYDGYLVEWYEWTGSCYAYEMDEDDLDVLFEAYEEFGIKAFSWEKFEDLVNLVAEDDDAFDDASDYLNVKELNRAATAWLKDLNRPSWLKEYAGYSKSREDGVTEYTFEPDLYNFLSESVAGFEKAADDASDFKQLQAGLKSIKSDLKSLDCKFVIGTEGKYVSEILIEDDYENGLVSLEIELYDFGEEFEWEDTLEDMLILGR